MSDLLSEFDEDKKLLVGVTLLTGKRASEIAELQWTDVVEVTAQHARMSELAKCDRFVGRAAELTSLSADRVHPHILRHSCAMALVEGGIDLRALALWLGHAKLDSTMIYVHANPTTKERALARLREPQIDFKRYEPGDQLLNFLVNL